MNETEMTLTPRAVADAPGAKNAPGPAPGVAPSSTPPNPTTPKPPKGGKGRWIALVVLIALAALGWKFFRQPAPEQPMWPRFDTVRFGVVQSSRARWATAGRRGDDPAA